MSIPRKLQKLTALLQVGADRLATFIIAVLAVPSIMLMLFLLLVAHHLTKDNEL